MLWEVRGRNEGTFSSLNREPGLRDAVAGGPGEGLCAGGLDGQSGVTGAGGIQAGCKASPPWLRGSPLPRVVIVRAAVRALGLGIGGTSLTFTPSLSGEQARVSIGSSGVASEEASSSANGPAPGCFSSRPGRLGLSRSLGLLSPRSAAGQAVTETSPIPARTRI